MGRAVCREPRTETSGAPLRAGGSSVSCVPVRTKYGPAITLVILVGSIVGYALISRNRETTSSPPKLTTNAEGQPEISYQMPASVVPTNCTVELRGHDVRVTFSSQSVDVTPACSTWVQLGASQGELWDRTGPVVVGEAPVCSLVHGGANAVVDDTGGQAYGQRACTQLLSTGLWTQGPPAAVVQPEQTTTTVAPPPPPPCPSGFTRSDYGDCIDHRHLPCPAGYTGYQNSQLDNCLETPVP